MKDMKDKLRSLDRYRSPVGWEDVERRQPRAISDGSSLEATPRRRVIAVAVAFAVFAAGGWLGWVALGPDRGIRPNVGNDVTATTRYQTDSMVLDDPGRPPVLCLGGVADSLPPQCDGIPIADWDWEAVDGEQSAAGSTWGEFHVVGTYDGETFTLLEAGPPRPAEQVEGDPVDTPCAEPEGGWSSPDPSKATDAHLRELMNAVEDEPDFAGFWIDYVVEPVGEGSSEPGNVIANVAFTGGVERHTERIRQLWGGPLCVVEHEHTFAELRGIQRELAEGAAADLGLDMTWSDVDIQDNVVELGVVVADADARAAVEARYGPTAVELHPALEPVP